MTCGNPFKHKIQKVFDNFLDIFPVKKKLTDEQMECMQFGICDFPSKQVEEIPYFHFWIFETYYKSYRKSKLGNVINL